MAEPKVTPVVQALLSGNRPDMEAMAKRYQEAKEAMLAKASKFDALGRHNLADAYRIAARNLQADYFQAMADAAKASAPEEFSVKR